MKGMTLIVKTITRILLGFILVFGLYIVFYGHLTPGGGFAGGVIMACSYILVMLAFGKETVLSKLSKKMSSILDSMGALGFLIIAALGISGGYFFYNFICHGTEFKLLSAGIILPCNIFIGIKVGAAIFGVVLTTSMFRLTFTHTDKDRIIKDLDKEED